MQVTDELEAYMVALLPKRDRVLARLEKEAEAEGIPIVGPLEGAFLRLLVSLVGARQILELGTATGYSGIWLLGGTVGGHLTTFETDPERAARARVNFAEAQLQQAANVVEQDAIHGVEALDARFDVCFIDLINSFGSEDVTERAFQACLAKLRPGGLLLADNALRQGEVPQPASQQARNAARYNQLVATSARLEGLVVAIRDGLSVARVKD
ncbi:MAG TPA: O-methyltransferase [Candidatus Dormibacteraeota bacterium]|nr:O-methyltransferase [Candidatus Dormibacteraeota bacterium]